MEHSSKPIVWVGPDEHRVTDEIAALLGTVDGLYSRAGELVEVVLSDDEEVSPSLRPLPRAAARDIVSRLVQFRRQTADGWKPLHPPNWCIEALLARSRLPMVPPLRSVVETPVFVSPGRVVAQPGYDPTSRLYLSPVVDPVPLPPYLTRQDAEAAAARLRSLMCDFEFAHEAGFSAWLAAPLTLLARYAFSGPAPLIVLDGSVRGVGKTLAADVAGVIGTGRTLAKLAPAPDEEMRTRITSIARAAHRAVVLDNVVGKLASDALDAALTTTRWEDRVLGSSEMIRLPLECVWLATGNNLRLGGDLVRRCLWVRLVASVEHPEDRTGFQHDDLLEYVLCKRASLIRDALIVLQAFHDEGRPNMGLPPIGSFEGWSRLVRAAIVHAGCEDPVRTREPLRELRDADWVPLELIDCLGQACADVGIQEMHAGELLAACQANPDSDWARRLGVLFEELFSPRGVNAIKLGRLLGSNTDRIFDGRRLCRRSVKNSAVWRVEETGRHE
jgi:hypothetical protein